MLRLSLLLGVFALTACDRQPAPAPVATSEEAGIEVRFPVRQGTLATRLRLAVTDLEKSRGLMGTPKLPENEGMAFLYESDTQMRFWMKDTPLDLDIAFVSVEGVILEVKTMRAGDTETTTSSSDKVRFTVEMASGWYARSGVKVGDKVDLVAVRAGLTARGFQTQRYLP
jgi:uncharacterized membrane protein (UPF0127 family)